MVVSELTYHADATVNTHAKAHGQPLGMDAFHPRVQKSGLRGCGRTGARRGRGDDGAAKFACERCLITATKECERKQTAAVLTCSNVCVVGDGDAVIPSYCGHEQAKKAVLAQVGTQRGCSMRFE